MNGMHLFSSLLPFSPAPAWAPAARGGQKEWKDGGISMGNNHSWGCIKTRFRNR